MKRTTFEFELIDDLPRSDDLLVQLRRVAGVLDVVISKARLAVTAEFPDGEAAKKVHRKLVLLLIDSGARISSMSTNLTEVFG